MTLLVTSALALALQPASAQIRLAGITEARGPGATAGKSLKSGYLMAIDEINASGGVLGQKLQLKQYDIESNFAPTGTNQPNMASVDACPQRKPTCLSAMFTNSTKLGPMFLTRSLGRAW